jgi:Kef-type K+ transport system membrane component KefB
MQASDLRAQGLIGLMAVSVLVAASAAEFIGIHGIFGAFLVGVAFAQAAGGPDTAAHEPVRRFVIGFFAPIYFASLGLRANFITSFDLTLVAVTLAVACVGKVGGASLGAWLGRMPAREALAVGVGMNARGAMEMILASVALEYELIDQRVFVALIVIALATSMLSGPLVQRLLVAGAPPIAVLPRRTEEGAGERLGTNLAE